MQNAPSRRRHHRHLERQWAVSVGCKTEIWVRAFAYVALLDARLFGFCPPTAPVCKKLKPSECKNDSLAADVTVVVPTCASNLLLLSPASLWGVLINSVGAHRCDEFRQTLMNEFCAHRKLCDPSTYASLAFEDTVQTPQSIHSTSGYNKTPIS